jgi:hypothetical protein
MVEQGKDGARNPAGFPALCAAALFFGFFFFIFFAMVAAVLPGGKVKERGIYRCRSTIHGGTLPW